MFPPRLKSKSLQQFKAQVKLCLLRDPFLMRDIALGFPGGASVKNRPANVGDLREVGSIRGLGRSPGGGYGNPPQYLCLENPMDRGA